MHQCLCISEILEVIFYFVFNDNGRRFFPDLLPDLIPSPETQDRRSIFRLALACRGFRDLALNVLYSNPRNLGTLKFILTFPYIPSIGPRPHFSHTDSLPTMPRSQCIPILTYMCSKASTTLSKPTIPHMARLFSHLYPSPQTPLTHS
ncbi:hypothetical protein BDR03DRAFT_664459 [Suillus americanus]|nr:hypothetical protein BDR03DRAFT_664459 [Suillus americanus]